jgi:hypothetical protein
MKIAVIGAYGRVGSRLAAEGLRRGHTVTAVVHDLNQPKMEGVRTIVADVRSAADLQKALEGQEVVIVSVAARGGDNRTTMLDGVRGLLEAMQHAHTQRLVWVGGAGCLEVAPHQRLMDAPGFPAEYKHEASIQSEVLEVLKFAATHEPTKQVDWLYVSPAAELMPGERTGKYRVGGDQVLCDSAGKSRISMEDFAVGVLDEVEKPTAHRKRITVAY